MATIDSGGNVANKANVNSNFQLEVHTPTTQLQAGFVCISSENDAGVGTGVRSVLAPGTDASYRLRESLDHLLDVELFNYGSQNTGKHTFTFTTLTCTISANGILTNSGNINTASTGCNFGTFAMFPFDPDKPLFVDTLVSFSAQPQSNVTIDFGAFQRGATTQFAPLDGAYFRLSSAGFQGVVNNNGVETTTAIFPAAGGVGTFATTNNNVYRFRIVISSVSTQFFINDVLYGTIANQAGVPQPFRSMALPWSFRHAIAAGGAGGSLQASFWGYAVGFMGPLVAENLGAIGNRILGSHQGLSGGTMGSLSNYANNVAAGAGSTPTNTTVIQPGLGGQVQELFNGVLNADLIIASYQVPAGSTTVQGRRLRIHGVRIDAFVSTVLAGGPVNAIWSLNFGHTAASLATAESSSFTSATTKAPRREVLGQQAIGAAAAVGTSLGAIDVKFSEPIYVNPGEFVAVAKKYYGTVGTSGVIQNLVIFDYGWE
jgi:hypothetical protein